MLTLAEWIIRLTKGYIKATGKTPDGLANLKIKLEAAQRVRDQSKVVKGDFNPNEEWWKARPTKATPFSSPQTPQEKIDWLVKNVSQTAETGIPPKATLEAMLKDGRGDLIDHFYDLFTKKLGGPPKINIDTSGLKHPELVKKMMMDKKLKPTLVKETEAQIKARMVKQNKETAERIRQRKYEEALKAEVDKMDKDPDYIPDIIDPEDFASGGRVAFKHGTHPFGSDWDDLIDFMIEQGFITEEEAHPLPGEHSTGKPKPTLHASGGIARVGFKNGKGVDLDRRMILKGMGALAALPVVGKFFKWAKPLAKRDIRVKMKSDMDWSYEGPESGWEGGTWLNLDFVPLTKKGTKILDDLAKNKKISKIGAHGDETIYGVSNSEDGLMAVEDIKKMKGNMELETSVHDKVKGSVKGEYDTTKVYSGKDIDSKKILRESSDLATDPIYDNPFFTDEFTEEIINTIKKEKMASGGIAGELHLNEGGRARFANGSPAIDPRMYQSYQQNIAENEAQRIINQNVRSGDVSGLFSEYGIANVPKYTGDIGQPTGILSNQMDALRKEMAGKIMQQGRTTAPIITDPAVKAHQEIQTLMGSGQAPIGMDLSTAPESRITNEAQANRLAELMAPGSTQSYIKPTFEQRMGGESWDMLSDGDQYRIAQEYPGQTPPRRNPGFIPSSFAKGGLAHVLGV